MKYESAFSASSKHGDCCTLNVSCFGSCIAVLGFDSVEGEVGEVVDRRWEPGWTFERMSIFSSFSSNKSFSSFTSVSSALTRSSNDSVYPRGKALLLSLSLVLHSKPTLAHWVQQGVMPSQRIFLLRHRSQAWAILLCALVPTLITFMGSMPGIIAVFVHPDSLLYCRSQAKESQQMSGEQSEG